MMDPFTTWVSFPAQDNVGNPIRPQVEALIFRSLSRLPGTRLRVVSADGSWVSGAPVGNLPHGSYLQIVGAGEGALWGRFPGGVGRGVYGNPPHYADLRLMAFSWTPDFCSGAAFESEDARAAYTALMRELLREPSIVRILDGTALHDFGDEAAARFVFYRDIRAFAQSLLLLFGLEGAVDQVLEALMSLEKRDWLTMETYRRKPAAQAIEKNADRPLEHKRLRLAPAGGIILEDGRFAVANRAAYDGTSVGLLALLAKQLLAEGVARPASKSAK